MDPYSPASVAGTATPDPSPLSPLKRHASQAEPSSEVVNASKRLKEALLDDDDVDRGVGGSGEGDRKDRDKLQKKDSIDSGSLSTKLEAQVTCGRSSVEPPTRWRRTSSCPTCRTETKSTADAYSTGALVELYLGLPGNEQEGRSDEEKAKMDESYKPGARIIPAPQEFDPYDDDDDDGFIEEDDDEGNDHYDEGEDDHDEHPGFHKPCPCCVEGNDYDFVCPEPTPNPVFNPFGSIPLHHPNPGHSRCDDCDQSCPSQPDFGSSYATFPDLVDQPLSRVLPNLFAGLAPEQKIIDDYLDATDGNIETIFAELFLDRGVNPCRPKFFGPALGEDRAVLSLNDEVCRSCALAITESALNAEWPKMMSEPIVRALLPPQVLNRADCWYGLSCRTAPHNAHHALRLNHLCPCTRPNPPSPVSGARTLYTPHIDPFVPPFDLSSVTFRDLDGAPVALASSNVGGHRTPGKCVLAKHGQLGRYQAWFSAAVNEGEQSSHGGIEVLWEIEGEVKWVRTSRGVVPDGERPVQGGRDDAGEELWHAAGWVKGVRVPGKTGQGWEEARLSFGGQAWVVRDDYDLLCWV
ncbi:hypothetical protein P7C70_g1886, partial [Phenoliferia sp. Uapishka_3]